MRDESPSSPDPRRASNLPELRALETFVTTYEVNSMTLAAERLGLSQSAVSQSIRALEDGLGVQLMDRVVRPARPTNAGRLLYEVSAPLLEQARAAMDQVRAVVRQEQTQIRLGCVDSFAATLGPPLIRAMASQSCEIQMWSEPTPTLPQQMLAPGIDMAICTDPGAQDPRIAQRLLFSEAWVAVFPKQEKVPRLNSSANLAAVAAALPLIRYSQRSVIGQQVERYLRQVGIQASRRYEFDSTDSLLSLVASGLGWAISTPLCLWQSRHHLKAVQVRPLPAAREGERHFYLLSRDSEWGGQDGEIARVTRAIMRTDIAPAIYRGLAALDASAISIPDEQEA